MEILEDGMFWSSALEAQFDPGPSDADMQEKLQLLRSSKVSRLTAPDSNHCGNPKNRFVEFAGGSGYACARNRESRAHEEYVQGEVMAFYLARLLGITNTPAVVLSKVRRNRMVPRLAQSNNSVNLPMEWWWF